jgi:ribosomal protein S27AE
MAVRYCPQCKGVYVEDDRIQRDTNRCPRCGADLSAQKKGGELTWQS